MAAVLAFLGASALSSSPSPGNSQVNACWLSSSQLGSLQQRGYTWVPAGEGRLVTRHCLAQHTHSVPRCPDVVMGAASAGWWEAVSKRPEEEMRPVGCLLDTF